ncbi:MAG TPA: DUF86 domain-containing protein [Patescibacteria group bacterium]|nr:DUF86 domain-containing protein [Patescibacteria group bacterium]
MIDKAFLSVKLDLIKKYAGDLEKVLQIPIDEIKKNFVAVYAIERIFQLIVDEVIDINNHIILRNKLEVPDDFQSTFLILAQNNVIGEAFAKRIAPVVGLRNILVHRYEKIDKDLFLSSVAKERDDFREYIKEMGKYVKSCFNEK